MSCRPYALFLLVGAWACGSAAPPPPAAAPEPAAAALPRLDAGKIVFAMGGHETEIRKCFFRNPRDRGTLRVRWVADESGAVRRTEVVKSSLETEAVESCLLERVAELRFGPLAEAAEGEWVFVFRLVQPPAVTPEKKNERRTSVRRSSKDRQEEEVEEEGIHVDDTSAGWLEPDRIESVIQAGYRLYARCYRSGLKRQEDLAGSLRFRITIGQEGRIETMSDEGSDLPDPFAVDCVAEAFHALEFPRPERGPVTVRYRQRLN